MEIEGSTEETQAVQVGRRSLIIRCHVTSDRQDHLQAIAAFIENLKGEKRFLKDFSGIKFHSADRNPEEMNTVDFTLTLPLARNMLREKTETVAKEKPVDGTKAIQDKIVHWKEILNKRTEEYDQLR